MISNPETFTHGVDPEFDADTGLAEVEGRAVRVQSLCTVADVIAAVRDGYTTTKGLVEHLCDAYAISKRTAERLIFRMLKAEGIKQFGRGRYILGRKAEKLCPPAVL